MEVSPAVQALIKCFQPIFALSQAESLLSWDQQVMMPHGGAEARAETLAHLAALSHQLLTSQTLKNELQEAERYASSVEEKRIVELSRRAYDQTSKIPEALATNLARATSVAQNAWEQAREKNDFQLFTPHLERVLDLTRQQAEALGYKEHIYDALLDLYEPGATHAQIKRLFEQLKPALLQIMREVVAQQSTAKNLWKNEYSQLSQKQVSEQILTKIGFNFENGRQDTSAHPFCTNFGRGDVRITTRYDNHYLPMALYGSLHEMGHGLYEQGSPANYEGTVLAGGVSLGVHESQSRLWENLIGRSLPFTKWLYPQLQQSFSLLADTSMDEYYAAINHVAPSPIRVEADEVTYNLHILLRFELESDLLTGTLKVVDLPAAWNAKMQEYFGLTPTNDAEGVLQDVHWSIGAIGYFPTYTIGNLLSAQLFATARIDIRAIDQQIENGEFEPLLNWLRTHIHQYASLLPANDLIVHATGQELSADSYLAYLREKYLK